MCFSSHLPLLHKGQGEQLGDCACMQLTAHRNSTTIFSFHSTTADITVGNVFTSGTESTLDGGIDMVKKPSVPPRNIHCTV